MPSLSIADFRPILAVSSAIGAFEIAGITCSSGEQGCVSISGTDAIAVASGFHYYLKYVANCSVSWWGDQLTNLPLVTPLPAPAQPISQSTTYTYRYYMNVVTFGYSTLSWYGSIQFTLMSDWFEYSHARSLQGLASLGARD